MQSLAFPSILNGINKVETKKLTALPDSCTWISNHPTFIAWQKANINTVWITGNSGVGKTKIMQHLVERAQAVAKTHTGLAILYFFFNCRGDPLEKSLLGCYHALLHQILAREPVMPLDIAETFLERSAITKVPKDLYPYYFVVLDSIDLVFKSQTVALFRWIYFSHRPLTVGELQHAMELSEDERSDSSNGRLSRPIDTLDTSFNEERVLDLSLELLELRTTWSGKTVQFIHQSVKNFMISDGLKLIRPSSSLTGNAHVIMARSCLRQFGLGQLRVSRSRSLGWLHKPLITYALDHGLQHAAEADSLGVLIQDIIEILSVAWDAYCYQHSRRVFSGTSRHTSRMELSAFSRKVRSQRYLLNVCAITTRSSDSTRYDWSDTFSPCSA